MVAVGRFKLLAAVANELAAAPNIKKLATLIWTQIKFAFENDVDDDGIIFYICTLCALIPSFCLKMFYIFDMAGAHTGEKWVRRPFGQIN